MVFKSISHENKDIFVNLQGTYQNTPDNAAVSFGNKRTVSLFTFL